jgi:hypothetical protein
MLTPIPDGSASKPPSQSPGVFFCMAAEGDDRGRPSFHGLANVIERTGRQREYTADGRSESAC